MIGTLTSLRARALAGSLSALTLAACGGGADTPGGGVTTTPPPAPTVPTPLPPPPATPNTTSSEYLRNPGLALIKPALAWTQGATGAGITVAVVDSGVRADQTDLQGQVSAQSTDIVGNRTGTGEPVSNHGTQVAGVIASKFNSAFTVGVAYDATILSVRVDGNTCDPECSYATVDIAAGIDYARTHGAKVVNLSLGTESPSPTIREALRRAADAGMVIAVSAGNDARSDPDWPARYATDSTISGALIAVGGLNAAGSALASFSNRAGVAQSGFLAAPGEEVLTDCTTTATGSSCWRVNGTSIAAPHVAASLALLLDGFPNLTGREAVDVLLRTARDLGDPGTDSTNGRGALDLDRAFSPVGTLSLPTVGGQVAIASSADQEPMLIGSAFGDALVGKAALATVGYDDYRRLFRVDLGAAYRQQKRALAPTPEPAAARSATELSFNDGGRLTLAVQKAEPDIARPLGMLALSEAISADAVAASYRKGAFSFDIWSGRGGTAPGFEGAPRDAFAALTEADHAARVGFTQGSWTFSAEGASGVRGFLPGLDFAPAGETGEAVRYARAAAQLRGAGWTASFGAGALTEEGGPLGGYVSSRSDMALPSSSRFLTWAADWALAPGLGLFGQGAVGGTKAEGRMLTIRNATSTSWMAGARIDCARVGIGCSTLLLSLSQPLRIEGGAVSAVLADQPLAYFDPLTYSRRTLSLRPSGRELDLSLGVTWAEVPRLGSLRLNAMAVFDEGHRKGVDTVYVVSTSLRKSF